MIAKTETAVAKTAYGKALDSDLEYSFSWEDYESIDEVKSAKDELSDKEVVKVRNNERKANARQKALTIALDNAGVVKPTLENDPQLRLRRMYDILIAAKKSHAEARELASVTLGIEWDSE